MGKEGAQGAVMALSNAGEVSGAHNQKEGCTPDSRRDSRAGAHDRENRVNCGGRFFRETRESVVNLSRRQESGGR